MTGPLTGTLVPSSGRVDVVTKSPETGLLGGSNAGGFWGPELKWAGYDGIIIKGKAKMVAKKLVGTEKAALPTIYEYKAKMVYIYENMHILADCLGVCSIPFQPVGVELWARAFSACTGIRIRPDDLMSAANRIRTLERAYNLREGLKKENDTVSKRFFKEALKDGPWRGEILDEERFEKMKKEYYALRGWDSNGEPTEETLSKLGLAC